MSILKLGKILTALFIAISVLVMASYVADKTTQAQEPKEHAVPIEVITPQSVVPLAAVATATASSNISEELEQPASLSSLLSAADVEKGAKLSRTCIACHSDEAGAKHKMGPNLWGIVNAEKGVAPDYKYSKGMLSKGGIWDYESLDAFLEKPMKYVKGTKMGYMGLKNPEERAAVIMWMRSLSDSPAPLPPK